MIIFIVLGVGLISTGAPMLGSPNEHKRSAGQSMILLGVVLIGLAFTGPQMGWW